MRGLQKVRGLEKVAIWFVLIALVGAVPALAQFGNRRAARPTVTLPTGPVRDVILSSCTSCHGIDDFAYHALDRDGWDAMIETMKTTRSGRVDGAVISDPDKEILLDWLVERFGPDSTAFPREYVPRELTEADYIDDEQAEVILAETCQSCHTIERVEIGRGDEAWWRALFVDMIGKGAQLALDDIEPLVEWSARTKGPQIND